MKEKIQEILEKNNIKYSAEIEYYYEIEGDCDTANQKVVGFNIDEYAYISLISNNIILTDDDYEWITKTAQSFKEKEIKITEFINGYRVEIPYCENDIEKKIENLKNIYGFSICKN